MRSPGLILLPLLALLAQLACSSDPASTGDETTATTDTTTEAPPDLCGEAEARLGQRVCEHHVPDLSAWSALSLPSTRSIRRVPASTWSPPATTPACPRSSWT
jgi:hypothetical protein